MSEQTDLDKRRESEPGERMAVAPASSRFPSRDDVKALLGSDSILEIVIQGHKVLDRCLTVLLAESLPQPDLPELRRLRFATRVDLVIGLGRVSLSSRGSWLELNRLRNSYAHSLSASMTPEEAQRIARLMPACYDDYWTAERLSDPPEVVTTCFWMLYFEARTALRRMRDAGVAQQTVAEMISDLFRGDPGYLTRRTESHDVLEERVQAARFARESAGAV